MQIERQQRALRHVVAGFSNWRALVRVEVDAIEK
jgi:hypothetical protein